MLNHDQNDIPHECRIVSNKLLTVLSLLTLLTRNLTTLTVLSRLALLTRNLTTPFLLT